MGNVLAGCARRPRETYTKVTFPEGFTLAQMASRLDASMPTHDGGRRSSPRPPIRPIVVDAPPARRDARSRACCSPTRTRCRTARRRPGRRADGRADGARRPARRTSRPRRRALGLHAVPDPDHRVDDRARGEDRRGPPEDRPGHLQPPRDAACRCRSTPPFATARSSTGSDPDAIPFGQQRQTPAVQHVPATGPAADADRQPRPGVDPGRAQPGAEPARRATRCAPDLPDGRDVPVPVLRARRRGRQPRLRRRRCEQHEANVQTRAATPACCDVIVGARRGVAAVIGSPVRHSLSPALHNAGVRRGRASTGRTSPSTSRRARPARALDACARSASAACRSRCRTRRTSPPRSTCSTRRPRRCAASTRSCAIADGRLVGHSTDGDGFVASLRGGGRRPSAAPRRGARRRRRGPQRRRRARPGRRGRRRRRQPHRRARRGRPPRWPATWARSATLDDVARRPTSSSTPRRSAWAPTSCRSTRRCCDAGQVVADLVYHPLETPLLAAARAAGARDRRRPGHARAPGRAPAASCGPASRPTRR